MQPAKPPPPPPPPPHTHLVEGRQLLVEHRESRDGRVLVEEDMLGVKDGTSCLVPAVVWGLAIGGGGG